MVFVVCLPRVHGGSSVVRQSQLEGRVGGYLLLLSLYERLAGLVVKDLCAVVAARLLARKLAARRVDLRSMREAIMVSRRAEVRLQCKCSFFPMEEPPQEWQFRKYKSDEMGWMYWVGNA